MMAFLVEKLWRNYVGSVDTVKGSPERNEQMLFIDCSFFCPRNEICNKYDQEILYLNK